MNVASEKESWEIALRGLQRFYDEGMTKWSRKDFYALFPSDENAKSDYVKQKLFELAEKKALSIVGEDDNFLIIHKI
jgi:hypothetical protein